jgi:Enzyme related to GTP cyclohydrolase I
MIKSIVAKPVDRVELETGFTAICPIDGSVDNYSLRIMYRPRCSSDECTYVELSSLREFLDSFRNKAVYHEDVLNEIMNKIIEAANPSELTIILMSEYKGIKYVIERKLSMPNYQHES